MREFRSVPTPELTALWVRQRDRVSAGARSARDMDILYEMKRELDRRRDEPKPVVDVNFSDDYLTD